MAPTGKRSSRKRAAVNGEDSITINSKRTLRHRKGKAESESINTVDDNSKKQKKHEKASSAAKENVKPKEEKMAEHSVDRNRPQPNIRGFNPFGLHSNNLVYRLQYNALGMTPERSLRQAVVQSYVEQLTDYRILTTASPFDRRVTAMQWHPTHPSTLAVGSKGGDLILWDFTKTEGITFVKGIGKGGSITHLQFDVSDPSYIYTSSIDGMVSRQDFHGNNKNVFLNTLDWSYWYSSLDVNYRSNVLVTGDSRGNTILMTRQGEKVWSHRLHKSKVTHCEFNKKCEWLLATASTDKLVKLWDIRKVSGRGSALYELPHDTPINSAYFSPDSTRLLTTDQHDEIRVYGGPLWDKMERSIAHPHRQFQHITSIKATWHPIHDLIVVGRYPDPQFPGFHPGENRTIDVFDANTGDMVCQLLDGSANGILSVCQFNHGGDYLATGMGYNILVWTDVAKLTSQQGERTSTRGINFATFDPSRGSNSSQRRRNRRNNSDDVDTVKRKLKIKIKTKTQTKTKAASER